MPNNQKNKAITEPDIRDSGILERSNAPLEGGSRKATSEELALALASSEARVKELEARLATSSNSSDAIQQLASAITSAIKPAVTAVPEEDNFNRTSDFRNQRATLDGKNMMESQQSLAEFKSEPRKPISIPKAMAAMVGANLPITVNGVRVSIPCDGATYYINESHWEAARERLAKLDILASNTEPQIVEIS